MSNIDFSKYVDLPFVEMGRNFNGVDCYGIPFLIFKEELGITLPDFLELKYDIDWAKRGENHILNNIWEEWEEIKNGNFKRLDLHIFYDRCNVASHIGINIGRNKMIHIFHGSRSIISDLSMWKKRLYGTIRYKKLYA